jgi:hypothetical protein
MPRSSRDFSKQMAFGIDQSQTGCGVSCIRVSDGYLFGSTTFATDKEMWPREEDYLFQLVRDMKSWIQPMMFNHGRLNRSDIIITLEDHGFQQYGNAHLNLVLAGMIWYWGIEDMYLDPGYDFHKCLPGVWKKWAKVKKPKMEMKKARKKGETDEAFAVRKPSTKLDVEGYKAMYPGFGKNENELDAYFIGLYGVHLWGQAHAARAKMKAEQGAP